MNRATTVTSEVRCELASSGMLPLGWFGNEAGHPSLLVGNIGSSLWDSFSNSDEYSDGKPDALDRWTARIIEKLAKDLNAEARFPFGEQLWPFQNYAQAATGMKQSPIGLLIHPNYGLWMAFRAVLVFPPDFVEIETKHADWHPCDRCVDKPCLTTCPIDAFTLDGYDYKSCKEHVRSDAGYKCKSGGCQARLACPIGAAFAYEEPHQAFHMAAYI